MTTLLTGASGFLGAHTAAALLARGERVRALVRTPSRLADALSPLGLDVGDDRLDVVAGDMTDEAAVRRAVEGCDAVVHAAATYSFRRRDAAAMTDQNTRGTLTVLGAALDAGVGHALHVSSTVALTRPGGHVLDGSSPVGDGMGAYSRSKVASEKVARALQDQGAPVSVINPGGILGPHDPYVGETDAIVRQVLRDRLPVWPRGTLQWVDVRDAAAVLAALLDHAPGGRWMIPGETMRTPHTLLRELTGRRLPARVLPAGAVAALATPGYLTGWSVLPGEVEGIRIWGCANSVDDTATTATLGLTARPQRESVADTVRWLVEAGQLTPRQAGDLAP